MKSGTQITLFEELFAAQIREDDELRALKHAGFSLNYVYGIIKLHIDRNTYQDKDLLECEKWVTHCGMELGDLARSRFGAAKAYSIGQIYLVGQPVDLPEINTLSEVLKTAMKEIHTTEDTIAKRRLIESIRETIRTIKKEL